MGRIIIRRCSIDFLANYVNCSNNFNLLLALRNLVKKILTVDLDQEVENVLMIELHRDVQRRVTLKKKKKKIRCTIEFL